MSLSRREVMLTQICGLHYAETDLVSQANRQIPRVLQVLGMESTDPTEICNLILELQVSRTQIALKTYVIYLSERKTSFRFFPVRAFWTARTRGEPHLILHLQGNFQGDDSVAMLSHPALKKSLTGPFTYVFTPAPATETYLEEEGVATYVRDQFLRADHDAIFQFLLVREEGQ